jgi:hypothetical protein
MIEYKSEVFPTNSHPLEVWLNRLGAEGWQVQAMAYVPGVFPAQVRIILSRQTQQPITYTNNYVTYVQDAVYDGD